MLLHAKLTFQYQTPRYPILKQEGPFLSSLLSAFQKEGFHSLTELFFPETFVSALIPHFSKEKYVYTTLEKGDHAFLCLFNKEDEELATVWIVPVVDRIFPLQQVMDFLVTFIDDPVVIMDREFQIVNVNTAFEATYGFSREAVIGKPFAFLWSERNEKEALQHILAQSLKDGSWSGKVYHRKQDGEAFLVLLRMRTILDEKGTPQFVFAIVIDLSEEEDRAQALLQEAYRTRLQQRKLLREFSEFAMQLHSVLLPKQDIFSAFFREHMVFLYSPRSYHFEKFYYFSHRFDTYFIALVETNQRFLMGGYLSLVIYNLLNQIINEELVTNPGDILRELQSRLLQLETILSLDEEQKLEICIGLFSISKKLHTARYASAGIPLFLYEIHASSSPLASEEIQVFYDATPLTLTTQEERESHVLKANPSTRFYLACSHFFQLPDLFQAGKSLDEEAFKLFLRDIAMFPLEKQEQIFYNRFEVLAKQYQKNLLALAFGI